MLRLVCTRHPEFIIFYLSRLSIYYLSLVDYNLSMHYCYTLATQQLDSWNLGIKDLPVF